MTKLLIFIGEGQRFDLAKTTAAIRSIPGVRAVREGEFIGAVVECEFAYDGVVTIVRISKDLETVTAEGLGDDSLAFALALQDRLDGHLSVTDMDYRFELRLREIATLDAFRRLVSVGQG